MQVFQRQARIDPGQARFERPGIAQAQIRCELEFHIGVEIDEGGFRDESAQIPEPKQHAAPETAAGPFDTAGPGDTAGHDIALRQIGRKKRRERAFAAQTKFWHFEVGETRSVVESMQHFGANRGQAFHEQFRCAQFQDCDFSRRKNCLRRAIDDVAGNAAPEFDFAHDQAQFGDFDLVYSEPGEIRADAVGAKRQSFIGQRQSRKIESIQAQLKFIEPLQFEIEVFEVFSCRPMGQGRGIEPEQGARKQEQEWQQQKDQPFAASRTRHRCC